MFKNRINLFSDLINYKTIYANIKSTNRNDFYKSTELGLNATIEAQIRKQSYNNEKFATFKGKDFFIIRTYEKTDDFMYLIMSESDLKSDIKLVKLGNERQKDGSFKKKELSSEVIKAHITYNNARVQNSNNDIKIKTIRQAVVKIRYTDNLDLDNIIEIDGKKWYIISLNNLHNLYCWTEIILEEVV